MWKWIGGIVLTLIVIAALAGDPDDSAAPLSDQPTESVAVESTTGQSTVVAQPPTTTTTLPPVLSLDDLPMGDSETADSTTTKVAQVLADQAGFPTAVDGSWGGQTQTNLDLLRAELGLGSGGLDEDLWRAVLSRPSPGVPEPRNALEGILIPEFAVYLDDDVAGYDPVDAERYVLPYSADAATVKRWLRNNNPQEAIGPWRWCEEITIDPLGIQPLSMFWWQRDGRELSISIRDVGVGRVELHLIVEKGLDPSGCEGADRTASDLEVDSTRYEWRDFYLDWQWRPIGTYTNRADTELVYFEVIYRLYAGSSLRFVERVDTRLQPGASTSIMKNQWFLLDILNTEQQMAGLAMELGDVYFEADVSYLEFSDGSSYGSIAP